MEHSEYIKKLKEFGTVTFTEGGEVIFHKTKTEVFLPCKLGCGATIPNQQIEERQYQRPLPHTRRKCLFCYKWSLPTFGEVSDNHTIITNAWDKSLRREAKDARIKYSSD